ncbi:SpoIIE family protein phosphatase [Conexibacter sp. JD483]|uniref:SpoIIE family protein phosphatase n=1 Tax=unclassified Conexibacter TaxID=2627773 RepID=UPI00271F3726|nr:MULTISPECIES: SpoIIE family protein phosphatase [unclassified Conexibacter]MDO8185415.1 SpoIIE family protein phosphatase [Conexibacter sp. CPCC 205706]MDO8198409.1 SpoIIE family protein phosphatase [Conexibacter sp. CPCC 205762]MDR9369371.1 SpoIIE family protein phosphatase [Conexibacter sp. JD483]
MSIGGALHADLAYGVAHACADGEQVSGDAWVALAAEDQVLLAAIDGLGHGVAAGEAAARAAETIRAHAAEPLPALMTACHAALADTRGAALTVARIELTARTLTWLGIGNVNGLLAPAVASASAPEALLLAGVVGDHLPQLVPVTVPFADGDTLLLATDGISRANAVELRVPGALGPLADGLLHRHRHGSRDDALVLVARIGPGIGTAEADRGSIVS